MDDTRRKIYREFNVVDSAEGMEMEVYPGKRPILYASDFSFSPPTDVWETEQEVVVTMEIAALTLDDFKINYREGSLIIEGERSEPATVKEAKIIKYHKKEIDAGKFLVKIKMNTRIAREKINASYENGMLTVHLPKNVGRPAETNTDIPVKVK